VFLILGIIFFILLIVVHEYGHFIVAKRNGIEVEEFGIGFPPKIAGKKMGKGIFEGYYTINALPLGGFVKLKGEADYHKSKGSFGAASTKAKMKVMLAGVFMNYLLGVVLFMIVALTGLPKFFNDHWSVGATENLKDRIVYIDEVVGGSPAEKAGIEEGDIIDKFAGEEITEATRLSELSKANAGKDVNIEYRDQSDGDKEKTTTASLNKNNSNEKGFFGTVMAEGEFIDIESPVWVAPINGFLYANQIFVETFKSIGGAISALFAGDAKTAGQDVTGPVGIVNFLATGVGDIGTLVFIIANLSIALAVGNLLPIPGLDGGRFYTTVIFKLFGWELTEDREKAINGAGVILLLILVILITYNDITRLL